MEKVYFRKIPHFSQKSLSVSLPRVVTIYPQNFTNFQQKPEKYVCYFYEKSVSLK